MSNKQREDLYFSRRRRFLDAEHEDGVDPDLLAKMLDAVTLKVPDLDKVRAEPWPGKPEPARREYELNLGVTWWLGVAIGTVGIENHLPGIVLAGAVIVLIYLVVMIKGFLKGQ